jgi:arginine deiminase
MNSSNIFVNSEIDILRKVIVHRPDEGIARISPKESVELLFDDIVFLPHMQAEHDTFTSILKLFLGESNVYYVENLLLEALIASPDKKQELIRLIVDYEELPASYADIMLKLDDLVLRDLLISGYLEKEDTIFFDPIPNFIFTRDIAVVVNDHVVITKAAKEARHRENFLTRFIFWAHPLFLELQESGRIINLNRVELFPPSKRGEIVSIEGGDMMMIHKDYLMIGSSERTTEHAIHSLKEVLFEKKIVKNVVQVNIPNDRSFMHIDTIFTRIHEDHMVAFKPIVCEGFSSNVNVYNEDGTNKIYNSVKDFILAEINPNMKFILSGDGESPYQEREQWTDGCNLVAIKPGVAISYDRNPHTENAFRKHGYNIISAEELTRSIEEGKIDVGSITNTIITIPSNELSRARGGSHCMTCPILRG